MKYYVIKTSRSGVEFKRYKCVDGCSKSKEDCWKFSKNGAQKIADRFNEMYGEQLKVHYNILQADKKDIDS